MADIQIDAAISAYLKLRGALEGMKDEHKAKEAVLRSKMDKLEAYFLDFLNKSGTDSIAARGVGTVFKQDVVSAKVADWDALLDWVRANNAWEFLERRVSKSAVQEFASGNDQLPPGVEMSTTVEVRIRTK